MSDIQTFALVVWVLVAIAIPFFVFGGDVFSREEVRRATARSVFLAPLWPIFAPILIAVWLRKAWRVADFGALLADWKAKR